jgi:hypothetical protein
MRVAPDFQSGGQEIIPLPPSRRWGEVEVFCIPTDQSVGYSQKSLTGQEHFSLLYRITL